MNHYSSKKPLFGSISLVNIKNKIIINEPFNQSAVSVNSVNSIIIDSEDDEGVSQSTSEGGKTFACIDLNNELSESDEERDMKLPKTSDSYKTVNTSDSMICIDLNVSDSDSTQDKILNKLSNKTRDIKSDDSDEIIFEPCLSPNQVEETGVGNDSSVIEDVAEELLVSDDKDTFELEEEPEETANESMDLLKPLFTVDDIEHMNKEKIESNWGYRCKHCDKVFLNKEELRIEYQKHRMERKELKKQYVQTCKICKKQFMNNINMIWHIQECTGVQQAHMRIGRFTRKMTRQTRNKIYTLRNAARALK